MHGAARVGYRVRQFARAAAAAVSPLTPADEAEARRRLSEATWPLFAAMPRGDQRHSLRVLRTLESGGPRHPALVQAALLHDCAKGEGNIRLWHRVAVVLIKAAWPEVMARWAALPGPGPANVRRPFWLHANHPEQGALLAADHGCDPLTVALIRWHHGAPGRPAPGARENRDLPELLGDLQRADNDN
jgi:hypothetical protein